MSQSISNVLLHIIFSTKNRCSFIDEIIQPEIYAYMTSILNSNGSYLAKIGGIEDHVHILCRLPRILSISDLLEEIKKNSSKWIKTKGCKYHNFSWQKGYGIFSVSESLQKAVSKYIENQKEHHKKQTFQDEYREFLRLNNISYDDISKILRTSYHPSRAVFWCSHGLSTPWPTLWSEHIFFPTEL